MLSSLYSVRILAISYYSILAWQKAQTIAQQQQQQCWVSAYRHLHRLGPRTFALLQGAKIQTQCVCLRVVVQPVIFSSSRYSFGWVSFEFTHNLYCGVLCWTLKNIPSYSLAVTVQRKICKLFRGKLLTEVLMVIIIVNSCCCIHAKFDDKMKYNCFYCSEIIILRYSSVHTKLYSNLLEIVTIYLQCVKIKVF